MKEKPKCAFCGQHDFGQTGEYPCNMCGLPTVHDETARIFKDGNMWCVLRGANIQEGDCVFHYFRFVARLKFWWLYDEWAREGNEHE